MSGPTVMRERLMCSNVIIWKCGRASAVILSYASSWCSQCDVECRTALTTGLGQNPPSCQNPSPTKIPIRPKNIADKNSPPGDRVRLHDVITKNWQVIVIVKTKCHCPPNLILMWNSLNLGRYLLIKERRGLTRCFFCRRGLFVWGGFWPEGDFSRRGFWPEGGALPEEGFVLSQ